MGAIRLALLLILAAVGIDSLQAMQDNADAHNSHPDARVKEPVPMENARSTCLDADQRYYQPSIQFEAVPGLAKNGGRVGCSHNTEMAGNFCWTYGCDPEDPSEWCWLPVYCGINKYVCEDHKFCVQSLGCMEPCHSK